MFGYVLGGAFDVGAGAGVGYVHYVTPGMIILAICYGLGAPAPAMGRLLLHDHRSATLTATQLAAIHVPDAELAYLSACSTATSNEVLADEFVHVAMAFRSAGFREVIATLWPVADDAAAQVASGFYSRTALAGTARSLHHAVTALRAARPDRTTLWAAHVHIG